MICISRLRKFGERRQGAADAHKMSWLAGSGPPGACVWSTNHAPGTTLGFCRTGEPRPAVVAGWLNLTAATALYSTGCEWNR